MIEWITTLPSSPLLPGRTLSHPESQWLGAVSPDRYNEALALFPKCYSGSFDACLNAKTPEQQKQSGFANCARINQLFHDPSTGDATDKKLEAYVKTLPFCAEPVLQRLERLDAKTWTVVGIVGLFVVVAIVAR
jgi:hypothetical protein